MFLQHITMPQHSRYVCLCLQGTLHTNIDVAFAFRVQYTYAAFRLHPARATRNQNQRAYMLFDCVFSRSLGGFIITHTHTHTRHVYLGATYCIFADGERRVNVNVEFISKHANRRSILNLKPLSLSRRERTLSTSYSNQHISMYICIYVNKLHCY